MNINSVESASELLLGGNDLDQADLDRTLALVRQHRIDYADLYLQATRSESWSLEDGQVKTGAFATDQGFGLRAIQADEVAFAYSQQLSPARLGEAARAVRGVAAQGSAHLALPATTAVRHPSYAPHDPLSARDTAAKLALLQRVDARIRARDPRVSRVLADLQLSRSVVLVLRHDGRLATDIRPMLSLRLHAYVTQNGRTEHSLGYLGGRTDFSLLEDERLEREIERLVDSALLKLEAGPAPSGSMPVVIGPGWPGMLLHEAMGHGFEGDFNRLGTSVYAGRLGERIAHPAVNIVDDATLEGRRGSLQIDDEGEPGQRTALIENGVLKSYLHDSLSARLMGQAPTGNGRRESYASLPMPRMTNTFMLAGDYAPQEVIASVKRGLYLSDLGSGQVDIVSGQYSFECELAYLIEDGRLTRPVKGATLTGNGPQTLRQISMVANDLALDRGGATCGKSGQSVPVCVGQPTLKVDELVVGGTA